MAVDLLAGGFLDKKNNVVEATRNNITNDYIQVQILEDNHPNLFDTFDIHTYDEDPISYMQLYDILKQNIQKIAHHTSLVEQLCTRYKNVTYRDEAIAIVNELDDIICENTKYRQQIKFQLLTEQKHKNDKYVGMLHKGSSVAQWRINQFHSCVLGFKETLLSFSEELNKLNLLIRAKQARHIDILDDGKLTEAEKEELVNDYTKTEAFLRECFDFDIINVSDSFIERLEELENGYQNMLRIGNVTNELEEIGIELNVLMNEHDNNMLNYVSINVEQTRDYVESFPIMITTDKPGISRSRRKMFACCCFCCFIMLLVILVISLIATGS